MSKEEWIGILDSAYIKAKLDHPNSKKPMSSPLSATNREGSPWKETLST